MSTGITTVLIVLDRDAVHSSAKVDIAQGRVGQFVIVPRVNDQIAIDENADAIITTGIEAVRA